LRQDGELIAAAKKMMSLEEFDDAMRATLNWYDRTLALSGHTSLSSPFIPPARSIQRFDADVGAAINS